MNIIAILFLVLGVGLFILARKGHIHSDSIQLATNIAGVLALLFSLVSIMPVTQGGNNDSAQVTLIAIEKEQLEIQKLIATAQAENVSGAPATESANHLANLLSTQQVLADELTRIGAIVTINPTLTPHLEKTPTKTLTKTLTPTKTYTKASFATSAASSTAILEICTYTESDGGLKSQAFETTIVCTNNSCTKRTVWYGLSKGVKKIYTDKTIPYSGNANQARQETASHNGSCS